MQSSRFSEKIDTLKNKLKKSKIWGIAIGFFGWYLINGSLLLLIPNTLIGHDRLGYAMFMGSFLLVINIGGLLFCAVKKDLHWIALGILIANAFNITISLFLGMTMNAICFSPFFVNPF